jgi:hypothetical protein
VAGFYLRVLFDNVGVWPSICHISTAYERRMMTTFAVVSRRISPSDFPVFALMNSGGRIPGCRCGGKARMVIDDPDCLCRY